LLRSQPAALVADFGIIREREESEVWEERKALTHKLANKSGEPHLLSTFENEEPQESRKLP
jgi:hypothetical protein